MKKIILGFVLLVIIVFAGGIYYVLNNLDELVKAAIETHGSNATQTAVRVDSVKLNLSDGSGAINGLSIANPKGYTLPHAFSLGEIRLGIDLQSLQQEPYIINEITVLAPQVFVEINKDNKTNLNQLKKNLLAGKSTSTGDTVPDQKTPDQTATSEPRLKILKVVFADGNIKAKVAALDNKEYNLKLPSINLTNLGGSNGATASELSSEILSRLTDHASKQVKEQLIDAKLDEIKAEAKAKIDEKKAELKTKADAEKVKQKQKIKDKLKGLF